MNSDDPRLSDHLRGILPSSHTHSRRWELVPEAWDFLLIIVPSLKHLVFVDGPGVSVLFLFLAEPLSCFIEVSISTAIHFCFPLVSGWFCQ